LFENVGKAVQAVDGPTLLAGTCNYTSLTHIDDIEEEEEAEEEEAN